MAGAGDRLADNGGQKNNAVSLAEKALIDKGEGWLILFRRRCPPTAKPETNCLRLTVYEFLSRLATD